MGRKKVPFITDIEGKKIVACPHCGVSAEFPQRDAESLKHIKEIQPIQDERMKLDIPGGYIGNARILECISCGKSFLCKDKYTLMK